MVDSLKVFLLQLLKVPAEPEPPAGSPASIRVFRASRNYYRLQLIRWALGQVSVVLGLLLFIALWRSEAGRHVPNLVRQLVTFSELIAAVFFLVQLPFTFLMVRLDFEMRWYMVSDRSLRIRSGIWNVNETTLTFANIQQITVQQGPLQRLLGISDLQVTTAGGGGAPGPGTSGKSMHCGYFHGIDNASVVKELMHERLRLLRDSGLGDPDEHPIFAVSSGLESENPLAAAQELLHEARLLRGAMAGPQCPPPAAPAS